MLWFEWWSIITFLSSSRLSCSCVCIRVVCAAVGGWAAGAEAVLICLAAAGWLVTTLYVCVSSCVW